MRRKYDGTYVPICEKEAEKKHSVRPADIRLHNGVVLSSFGKYQIEVQAGRLVQFFQRAGYWKTFTLDDIRAFYTRMGWDADAAFYGLFEPWFDDQEEEEGMPSQEREPSDIYVIRHDDHFCITDRFIERCAPQTA